MKVSEISAKYVTPKKTGYTALAGFGLTVLAAYSGNKAVRRAHKPLALFSVLVSLIHVLQIEYNHRKWMNKK